MNPLAEAQAAAAEILEEIQNQIHDDLWLRDKLRFMRDKIGECQAQYVYGPYGIITNANPADSAIDQMLSGEVVQFAEWVIEI